LAPAVMPPALLMSDAKYDGSEILRPPNQGLSQLPRSSQTKMMRRSLWREAPNAAVMFAGRDEPPAESGPPSWRTSPKMVTASGTIGANQFPALVLNADYTPLSYLPLSLWSWQDTVKAVFRDIAIPLCSYDVEVSSPSMSMPLPSVIALQEYIPLQRKHRGAPSLSRKNLFLRDHFACRYCSVRLIAKDLTFDHVMPRARQGKTSWENVVTACSKCNLRKGDKLLKDIPDMSLSRPPHVPSFYELHSNAKEFLPPNIHSDWEAFLGVDSTDA